MEELAAATGVAVDTIRYYQRIGLLAPPRRAGRVALYDAAHRERIERVRQLATSGFTLAQIKAMVGDAVADPLLADLLERQVGASTLDRAGLAERSGLDPSLIALVVDSGLLRPLPGHDAERFSADVLPMLMAARELLDAGLPVDRVAAIAVAHAHHVEDTVDAAIDVFTATVDLSDAVTTRELVDRLVPAVTRLVADHFERTLVERASSQLVAADGPVPSEALR